MKFALLTLLFLLSFSFTGFTKDEHYGRYTLTNIDTSDKDYYIYRFRGEDGQVDTVLSEKITHQPEGLSCPLQLDMVYLLHLYRTDRNLRNGISIEGCYMQSFTEDGHAVYYYRAEEISGRMIVSANIERSKNNSYKQKYTLDEIDVKALRDYYILSFHSKQRRIEILSSIKRSESTEGNWKQLKIGEAYCIKIKPLYNLAPPIGYDPISRIEFFHKHSVYLKAHHYFYTSSEIKEQVIRIN